MRILTLRYKSQSVSYTHLDVYKRQVRNDAPLLVGGTGQGDQGILAGDIVLHLYRIARGIDVRHRCLHPVVDHNTALDPQFQTSFFRESGVRRDACLLYTSL